MRPNALLYYFQTARLMSRHSCFAVVMGICIFGASVHADDKPLAPDFVLRGVDGTNLRLSEFRGEVVLLSFWAQWCGECRQALGPLNDLYAKYQKAGLELLGINVDEDPARAASAAKNLKVAFPVLLDDKKQASSTYRIQSLPLLVLIDRDGRVQYTHAGYQSGDERQWSQQVRSLLNQ